MSLRVLFCAALAAVALSDLNTVRYMENILHDLPIKAAIIGLDPLKVHPFGFEVFGHGENARSIKAKLIHGSMTGLGRVSREGDCEREQIGTEVNVGCNVTLGGVRVSLDLEVEGDSTWIYRHNISVTTVVEDVTRALIKIRGFQGLGGRVSQITVFAVVLTSTVSEGTLDLDQRRFDDFVKQLNAKIANRVYNALGGPFFQALNELAAISRLP